MSVARTLRGRLLCPRPEQARVELVPDGLVEIDAQGTIVAVEPAPADCDEPESFPGAVLLPGFVDTHVHFPQTRILGSASGPLLPWLERSVFPEEARFAEARYAAAVAWEFCEQLVRQGTTCAAIYSSSHPIAAELLFTELERRGLRALAGLTPFAPLGAHAVDSLTLPDGAVDFHGAFEPALGHYRQASLFSPMWQFANQDAARATAEEVMNLLFPAAPAPDLSRRRLFGLRA